MHWSNYMEYISAVEAARRLHKSERTIRQWIAEGKLSAQKSGKEWQIAESDVESLWANLTGTGSTEARIKDLETRLAAVEEELARLKKRVGHVPTREKQHRVKRPGRKKSKPTKQEQP
jgi:excisionase family DNA binding protein